MSTYQEIISQLQSNSYAPVYLLQGEETFFIDNIVNLIEANALDETQKSFNQLVLYGKDTSFGEVIGAARKYPMMGERQVVIVKEAQELKGWNKEDIQELILSYLDNPLSSTILVFAHKYKVVDKRTKVGKAFDKKAIMMTSKKLYDNEVPSWIQSYCRAKQVEVDMDAVMMLTENIGNNLQRLANEVDKLVLNVAEDKKVTAAMIQRFVGISKEYNIFELQKAIGSRNAEKALKIVNYFASNPSNNPMVLTIYSLFTYFSKLLLVHHAGNQNEKNLAAVLGVNPYFIREYVAAAKNYNLVKVMQNIHFIQEADLQSKGIQSVTKKDGPVLTELIVKLIN